MNRSINILVNELCKQPKDFSRGEFKHNSCKPTTIGENVNTLLIMRK